MVSFPRAETEIEVLTRFAAVLDQSARQSDPTLDNARTQTQGYLARLEAPVRIAVAGLSRSGKSSLVNLLVGEGVIPTQTRRKTMPAVVLRHAPAYTTTAGWWDREDRVVDGLALDQVLADEPDIVSFGIDCEVLRDIWLMDLSDIEESGGQANALFVLNRLADMIIWCTNAEDPWTAEERHVWGLVPKLLQKRSLLVLTHADHLSAGMLTPTLERLKGAVGSSFRAILPVATTDAWRALQGTAPQPEKLWGASGIEAFMVAMLELAVECRKAEIEKVRRGMAQHLEPLLSRLPMAKAAAHPPTAVKTQGPGNAAEPLTATQPVRTAEPAPSPAVAPAQAEPAAAVPPAIVAWRQRMGTLNDNLKSGSIATDADFLAAAQETLAAYVEDIAGPGALPESCAWIAEELDRAQDLLILMQYEHDERNGETAALLLAQMTDSLAHAKFA
jgi:hypothetical protein